MIEICFSKCLGENKQTTHFLSFHIIIKLDLRLFFPVGLSTSLWWKGEMKGRVKEFHPRHVAEVAYTMRLENESLDEIMWCDRSKEAL